MPPLLEVAGLRKSFGPVRALCGADLSLEAGEVLALVGDNGAGKSIFGAVSERLKRVHVYGFSGFDR